MKVSREGPVAEAGMTGHALVLAEYVQDRLRLGGGTPVFTVRVVGQVEVKYDIISIFTIEPPTALCGGFVLVIFGFFQ
jgi:hypothetical protein